MVFDLASVWEWLTPDDANYNIELLHYRYIKCQKKSQ